MPTRVAGSWTIVDGPGTEGIGCDPPGWCRMRSLRASALGRVNLCQAIHRLKNQPTCQVASAAVTVRDGFLVLEALGPPPPKVILVSAFAHYSPEDIDRMGLGSKVTPALRKPYASVELLAAVNDAMDELERED